MINEADDQNFHFQIRNLLIWYSKTWPYEPNSNLEVVAVAGTKWSGEEFHGLHLSSGPVYYSLSLTNMH